MTDIVRLAREVATEAHEGQTRWDKTIPYITHPAAVVAILAEQEYNDYVLATAWLHDVVEDTELTIADLTILQFPSEVLTAVNAITKRKDEEYLDYLLRVRRNEIARAVKIADITHNLSDLRKGSMRQKYQLAIYILENSF